jgi:hypothetical protein
VTDDFPNDTNEESLHYFACITNHYLRLVRSSNQDNPRHTMQYPIIADSGANYHMFRDPVFFGKTALDIQGIGTVKLNCNY